MSVLSTCEGQQKIPVIVLLQYSASATLLATETKPERLNVPLLITTRAFTVQGGRRVALHAFYNPWILQDIF